MSRQIKGIDISEHQSSYMDYTTMAKKLDFVIIREGCRQRRDNLFLTHVNGFRAAGVPIKGVYHFIYALSVDQAKREAESAIRNIKAAGLPKTTWIWADFEYDTVDDAMKKGVTLTAKECNSFTRAFCETIEAAGYPTGIYTNLDYHDNYYDADLLEKYPVWLCHIAGAPKYPCTVWQYSVSRIPGYDDDLDMDIWFEGDDEEMTTTEKAIRWMESLAKDDSHGYDQIYRWGEKGDYDCSSAVISAWEQAGVPVKSEGGATYTGNMYTAFTRYGFADVTGQVNLSTGGGLRRGDVLLNHEKHTAMYCGNGQEVEASVNEKGTATGGKPGDQTGKEILIRPYRGTYPWDCVLRYQSTDERKVAYMFATETVKKGDRSASARLLQTLLKGLGYTGIGGAQLAIDGDAGTHTDHAIREYQADHGLEVDGECGRNTWQSIIGL